MTRVLPVTAAAIALTAGACALALPSSQDAAPSGSASPPPEISAIAEAAMTEHAIPALGVAYVEDGALVWAATWGADEDALFNLASLAKPVTAETVLRLASDGAVDLEASMAEHYVDPDIADDPRSAQLTARLALTHLTGLPNWRDGLLAFIADPGTRPTYSGEGYDYVAHYAEAVTGERFDTQVETHVIAPLAVEGQLSIGADARLDARRLSGHDAEGEPTGVSIHDPWSAADDVWATPEGYGRFLASMMRGDGLSPQMYDARETISFDQAPFACAQGPLAEFCPNALGFGYGRVVFEYDEETVILQGGGDAGEAAIMFYSKDTGRGMVIMANSVNGRKAFPALAATITDNEDFLSFLQMQAEQ